MKLTKKFIKIIWLFVIAFIILGTSMTYAKTEAEELKELLDEYKDELGDLSQLKDVVDTTYNDLYSATNVDDTLKTKLEKDVENFDNIDGINPLILSVIDIELSSQINNLTDDNISDMREEITAIKEWVDLNVEDDGKKEEDNNTVTNEIVVDKTTADKDIPKTGIVSISLLVIAVVGIGIISIIKYRNLKEVK